MFKIAIVGRPNVGKSTMFNRLTGTRYAIIHDQPGVTRDRREGQGHIGPLEFTIFDTPGLEKAKEDTLQYRMAEQTDLAIDEADLSLFVVDAKVGLTAEDYYFAEFIRKKGKATIVVMNKAEGSNNSSYFSDCYKLGCGEPVLISAEHGEGMADLYDAIDPYYQEYSKHFKELEIVQDENAEDKALQIAIVGRPNAGKSTLINKLLKKNRMLTGPEAGITRDAISIDWEYKDKKIKLIDTAGMRKKSNVVHKLENLAVDDSLRSIRYAHVVILVLDAEIPLERQDLSIANIALKEGRSLVIAMNKWDMIEDKSATVEEIRYKLEKLLPSLYGVPIIYISALRGTNIYALIDASLENYKKWNYRIPTTKLNEWLKHVSDNHALPVGKLGRRLRIKYMTQVKTRPPTFLLFTTQPAEIPDSYIRYLNNSLRKEFGFHGVPLRFNMRKAENPYSHLASKKK